MTFETQANPVSIDNDTPLPTLLVSVEDIAVPHSNHPRVSGDVKTGAANSDRDS